MADIDKGCITDEWRGILQGMVAKDADKAVILGLLDHIPRCEDVRGRSAPTSSGGTRKAATLWPSPAYYINEKGEKIEYGSPSAMYTALTGLKPSGAVCVIRDGEKVKCRSNSLIDNFYHAGFIVRGNGEPAPVSDEKKSDAQNQEASESWKRHLLDTGKHFTVLHPKSPELQEAAAKADAKKPTKKGG
jgi:hypothetical protein